MTPPGKRVQTINPPGSEVGPGTVATWGKAITDEVERRTFHLTGAVHNSPEMLLLESFG
jgi:hypothetical protein